MRLRRILATAAALTGAAAAAGAYAVAPAGASAHSATSVAATQVVAQLTADHSIYSSPRGRIVGSVSKVRPITGEQTVLPVLRHRTIGRLDWLRVRLPGRPNSHTGWIKAVHTNLSINRWHIVISLGERRALTYYGGKLRRDYLVVVGKPSTPTPTGQFFVEETVAYPAGVPGNPYALATSARSNVFTEFEGGPGQVALHGINDLGGTPGQAQSHGCIRFTTADITWLARHIAPGTPITIKN